MSFNWIQYLRLAELLTESDSEAAHRAAISRAYYAVFCICRNYLRDQNELIPAGDTSDHAAVASHFYSSQDINRKRIGDLLKRLRGDRNSADYDDDLTGFPKQMSHLSIKQANEILDLLKKD